MKGPDPEKYAAGMDYNTASGLWQWFPSLVLACSKGAGAHQVLHTAQSDNTHLDQDRDSSEEQSFTIMLLKYVFEIAN